MLCKETLKDIPIEEEGKVGKGEEVGMLRWVNDNECDSEIEGWPDICISSWT